MKKMRFFLLSCVVCFLGQANFLGAYIPGLRKIVISPLQKSPLNSFFKEESPFLVLNCTFDSPLEASGSFVLALALKDHVQFKLSIGPMVYYVVSEKDFQGLDRPLFNGEGVQGKTVVSLEAIRSSLWEEKKVGSSQEGEMTTFSLLVIEGAVFYLPSGLNTCFYEVLNLQGARKITFDTLSMGGEKLIFGLEIGDIEI